MAFESITIPTAVASLAAAALAVLVAYLRGRTKKARNAIIDLETAFREFIREELDLVGVSPAQAELSRAELESALTSALDGYHPTEDSPVDVRVWDGRHFAPAPEALDSLATIGRVLETMPYRPARFDCENFAGFYWSFAPLIFGVNTVALVNDTSAGHAYNLIVDAEGGIHVYEPQDAVFLELGETYNDVTYSLAHGEVTF
ncbi:hypothetical protein [Halobellus rubicundus]|uniref:Uncharacterized protein n=1 Tax=Halobellus rubicundus TaxID=2996466 RepID=A0ABD5MIS2_9EURY